MVPRCPTAFCSAVILALTAALFASEAMALPKKTLAQAYCECSCVRTHEGANGEKITENLGTKTFLAPGGDAQSCSGQSGGQCRSGSVEGELTGCSGYVERTLKLPDLRALPDAGINLGQ
jgi:hypothetical protein